MAKSFVKVGITRSKVIDRCVMAQIMIYLCFILILAWFRDVPGIFLGYPLSLRGVARLRHQRLGNRPWTGATGAARAVHGAIMARKPPGHTAPLD